MKRPLELFAADMSFMVAWLAPVLAGVLGREMHSA
jgi:hypothetical protein